jgi:hypothetical protein
MVAAPGSARDVDIDEGIGDDWGRGRWIFSSGGGAAIFPAARSPKSAISRGDSRVGRSPEIAAGRIGGLACPVKVVVLTIIWLDGEGGEALLLRVEGKLEKEM